MQRAEVAFELKKDKNEERPRSARFRWIKKWTRVRQLVQGGEGAGSEPRSTRRGRDPAWVGQLTGRAGSLVVMELSASNIQVLLQAAEYLERKERGTCPARGGGDCRCGVLCFFGGITRLYFLFLL